MADRLGDLQENVRKQERHAMFGRVAAGLVHDLSHPFKNVQNNCRLVVKMHDDPEYLELFRRTIDREFAQIKRVFEDLRNIARPDADGAVPARSQQARGRRGRVDARPTRRRRA